MKRFCFALALLGAGLLPPAVAQATPASSFAEAVDLCLRFGADPWFAQDRFEEAGWRSYEDPDFGSLAFKSPDGAVIALPPTSDSFPMWCSVMSGSVSFVKGMAAAENALLASDIPIQREIRDNCPVYHGSGGQELRIFSEGNDDLCNDPETALVHVVTFSNPLSGQ
ncbi:hypothetical protein SAMN05877809_10659 [Rhodobacter sp. JA431]|uniref:hypothetical protein n=1 Tax=Rhodobacter sp. JA431 TaxID=570013 RepID=UPI000BD9AA2D|nr:hypothetical protein [Rhodobacter sp. JA431]SOC12305.1 hypothetical protein SAMN05877809_10659 [Rhodobacter sp. JA431]